MQLGNAIISYTDSSLKADKDCNVAFNEFIKNIPGRILQSELDISTTNKQGIVQGDAVYKYGIITDKKTVFLEYYENRSQGSPTMSIFADLEKIMLTIRGCKIDKRFVMCFKNVNGKIEKVTKFED